jgi:hypothetical protein
MGVRVKKHHPALKHAGYSAIGLLPGEDPVAFAKLHQGLRAEHCPDGPLEEDTVRDIARYMWRKRNLAIFRIAEAARERNATIRSEMIPSTKPPIYWPDLAVPPDWTPPDPADVAAATQSRDSEQRNGHFRA